MKNIIELAKKAGFSDRYVSTVQLHELEQFAKLVRAEALDQAAAICEDHFSSDGHWCASVIRSIK